MIDGISRTKYAWLLLFPWLLPAQNASFNLSTATIVVGATAGNASVQLVASPPTAAWTAASNASWLQLAPASASGTGSALVQFSYAANPNTVAQSGTLTIAGQTLTVTQAGSGAVPLSIMTTLISQGLNLPLNSASGPTAVLAATATAPVPPPNMCSAASTGLPELSATLPATPFRSRRLPRLPASCYAPSYPATSSSTTVSTAAALQSALTSAVCGEEIVVTAGLTYDGPGFTVPALSCSSANPVLVVSSAIASLPQYTVPPQSLAGGTLVPTLTCNTNGCATLSISDGASGWYFAGLEFTVDPSVTAVYPVVAMGDYTTTVGALPQHITLDRCLIHPYGPTGTSGASRGLDLNAVYGTAMFNNIWGFVSNTKDTQAVLIYNTTGPELVTGNHLEATGENLAIFTVCASGSYGGQGIPSCPPPSDITVTRNHFLKLSAWQNAPSGCPGSGPCYDVKNQLECKSCQRVMVDSNWFDTTFAQGQDEFTIVNCVFSGVFVCTDLTYTNNLFEHGPTIGVFAGNTTTATGQRMLFRNNLAIDVSGVTWGGGYGWTWQFQNSANTTVDHNTMVNTPNNGAGFFLGDPSPSTDTAFQWTNNFDYGSPSADGDSPGQAIADLPSPVLGGDVFVGDYWPNINTWGGIGAPLYPAGILTAASTAAPVAGHPACNIANKPIVQCWPLDWALVGFMDFTGGNAGTDLPGMALAATSPYHNTATDGTDIGANVPAVLAAIKGVQ